jgi:hypothetical protein
MQWIIEDRLENAAIGYRAIVDADGYTVCNPSPMGEANARLIAAAPDLLAACQGLIEYFIDPSWDDYSDTETMQAARAAIAKATGDQTI